MTTHTRRLWTCLLLAGGLVMWWWTRGLETHHLARLIGGLLIAGVGLVPVLGAGFAGTLDRFNRAAARRVSIVTAMLALCAGISLYFIAVLRGRALFPLLHDEFMYLLQARMLAGGRLWLPQHPLADFFETFFVFVRPVYGSVYFPGTALLNVPGIWLDLPSWIIPLLVSSAIVALFFCIVTELCDAVAGALAALLLISLATFRGTSIMVMSHPTVLLLGLGMIFAWLRWRGTQRSAGWALALGALAGWAAVTRPSDAVAFAFAVGLGLIVDLRGKEVRKRVATSALIVVAASPFLILQIVFDRGVTGKTFYTPYQMYLDREQPQTQFSFVGAASDAGTRPVSALPEKRAYYKDFLAPEIRRYHAAGPFRIWFQYRWRSVVEALFPHPALLLLVPVGLLGLIDRRRWVLAATAPLLVVLYSFNPVFLQWYTVAWMPGGIFLVVLGIEQISLVARQPAHLRAGLSVGVAAIALWTIVDAPPNSPERLRSPILAAVHDYELRQPPGVRQVLLFGNTPTESVHSDPVFNISTPWPDDALVIRARDLGVVRNRELVEYFAKHQPDRQIITIDMGTAALVDHGPAGEAIIRWPAP